MRGQEWRGQGAPKNLLCRWGYSLAGGVHRSLPGAGVRGLCRPPHPHIGSGSQVSHEHPSYLSVRPNPSWGSPHGRVCGGVLGPPEQSTTRPKCVRSPSGGQRPGSSCGQGWILLGTPTESAQALPQPLEVYCKSSGFTGL